MRSDASNQEQVQVAAGKVQAALADPSLQGVIEQAAAHVPGDAAPRDKVASLLSGEATTRTSSGGQAAGGPYLSRAPLVSMMQSQIEQTLNEGGAADAGPPASLWSKIERVVRLLLHMAPGSFTQNDPEWYIDIARGILERLAEGNAPFNPAPAEYDDLADDARLVVVGDWGTGLPRAIEVAARMRQAIETALADGRQVHVIHLGDVYYSGFESEDKKRFLKPWPVTVAQAGQGVTSWSLNGNHDMYSGGFGYFGTLLGDARFSKQRSPDGKATSFFRLRSPSWDFIGLDTAWDTDVTSSGETAVLQDPQGKYVADVAAGSPRKLVLFSHHQLVSHYDQGDLGPALAGKLAPVLDGNRVTAWWWGHEHRAITYGESAGVRYPRCLGNGGVPIAPDQAPPAGSKPAMTWRSTRTVREHGQRWNRFGFAVLDLHPDHLDAAYIDDDGYTAHQETVS
ncbi:MAG TPA: metallophosphoesterase [Streptosporangiaceae bacterium]|jgi:hypothetical protein